MTHIHPMQFTLTAEDEAILEKLVKTGRFSSKDAAMREALRILREDIAQSEAWRQQIADGLSALENGDYREYDQDGLRKLAKTVKARGRKADSRSEKLKG